MSTSLTSSEIQRYSRHLLIPDIGQEGQLRLKNASVLLIGTGGLGSPAALYLAAAGVGRLGLIDPDAVDLSNLHRQILHGESGIGTPKLDSAHARLREINPHVALDLHPYRLTPDNAMQVASEYDIIVDGCDNFPTRFLTNDTAFFLKKPLVYGAIHRFEGQLTVFAPHLGGPCYRCLLPEMPPPGAVPSCAEAGVLGALPGIIGSLQAMETLKLIIGIGEAPLGKLTIYDALGSSFRTIKLRRDPSCRLCGEHPNVHSVSNPETATDANCGFDGLPTISIRELCSKLQSGFEGVVLDVREPHEHAAESIPGSRLIPLRSLPERLRELPKNREILVHCKSGGRSARAVAYLAEQGFSNVKNVSGGIDAWLAEQG
jgi:molybdopterin/thiamine biosynthesis adenylyltransferase/rhodanese-related sulfurtransferase